MDYTIDTFDWKYYIGQYSDLRNAGILTKKKAWKHWRLYGSKENRLNRMLTLSIKTDNIVEDISRSDTMVGMKMQSKTNSIKIESEKKYKYSKIVIISENSPGVGGFGTRAFNLYNLLNNNSNVQLIYIDHNKKDIKRTNELSLNVSSHFVDNYYPFLNSIYYNKNSYNVDTYNKIHEHYNTFIDNDTLIIAITPLIFSLIYHMFPTNKIIYYCGSCIINYEIMNYNKTIFAQDKKFFEPRALSPWFVECLNNQNVSLFANSYLAAYYLNIFCPGKKCEILFLKSQIKYKNIENKPKQNDIIFIATCISRKDKNYTFCHKILEKIPKLSKIIIGNNSNHIDLPNCSTFDILPHKKCIEQIKNSKICLITSLKDVSPNIFFECIQNECTPFLSTGVGLIKLDENTMYKHTYSLTDINIWVSNIRNTLNCYKFDTVYYSNILINMNRNLSKIILPFYTNVSEQITDYEIIIYNNVNNIYNYKYNNNYFERGKNIQIINSFDELTKTQYSDKFIIFVEDTILPYNWTNINEKNKELYKLTNSCFDDFLNVFDVFNSNKHIYIFKNKFIKLFKNYVSDPNKFLYDINCDKIFYHNKIVGVEINDTIDIVNKYKLGILFINQFDTNVFKEYIVNNNAINNDEVIIFILYGKDIPLGRFENSYNFIYVNESNINQYIEKYKLTNIYILYLPLPFIENKDNIDILMNNHKIEKYIFIGGMVSHMLEYIEKYNNFTIVTVGTSYYKYLKKKNIIQYPIWPRLHGNILLKKYNFRQNFILKKTFINIGRMSVEKNQHMLIKAFHMFLKNINDYAYKLYIVGNNTAITKNLILYINNNKLQNNILILPWMDASDLYSFCYKNIDYHITTSTNEGLSGVVLETMTLGIPSISGNICCINDIIKPGVTGLFFEYTNYNKYLFEKYITDGKLFVDKINTHMDQNVINLVNILKQTHCNIELYNKLSKNSYNYMIHNYTRKTFTDYNNCFKLNDNKKNIFAFIFNSQINKNAVLSINLLTKNYKLLECEFNINTLKLEIAKIANDYDFIIIINDNYKFISEHGYKECEYFQKKISPFLDNKRNDNLGNYFMTQNLYYGISYNICIYNTNNFIKNIDTFTLNTKQFELLHNNKYNFQYNKEYIAFYNEEKLDNIFKNKVNLNSINFQYVKELFNKYDLNNIVDITTLYQTKFNIKLTEKNKAFFIRIVNECIILDPINNSFTTSGFMNTPSDVNFFNYLIDINNKQNINIGPSSIFYGDTNKNNKDNQIFDFGFVYSHYISNNNFERKLFYYIKKLKEKGLRCCLIIPNNSFTKLKVPFNYQFDNIIFSNCFGHNTLRIIIKKFEIKNVYFIDTNFNKFTKEEHIKLSKSTSINLILSGLVNTYNRFLIDQDYINIISTILTNSNAHVNIFKNYDIKLHRFWDIRKQMLKTTIKNTFTKNISYIGRFYKEKQCEILYNVFIKIGEKYPKYTFNFYGIGSSLDNKKNTKNVKIYNKYLNKIEVDNVIENSDFIIQNSCAEGNPAIIWESFKLNTPVICSNIYGNNYAVNNTYNGFLYDLDGYDAIKNDLTLSYDNILEHLDKYRETTEDNIYNCIEKVINLDIKSYQELQKNCLKSWESFSDDSSFDVLKLF